MKDIVERLRGTSNCAPGCEGRCTECPDTLMRNAADAIERLTVALEWYARKDWYEAARGPEVLIDGGHTARVALTASERRDG